MSDRTTPTRRRGRRTKFSPAIVAKLCDSIADGMPIHYAATLAGVAVSSVHYWQQRFPDFRQAIEEARARGINENLKVIQKAARTDWRAAAWYLEHVHPENFARNRVEISGPDGAALQTGGTAVLIYLPAKDAPIQITERTTEVKKNET